MQAAQARVVELWEKSIAESLSEDELWEHAMKTDLLDGAEAATPLFLQLLDRSPDHASANFSLGRLLLAQGDPAGPERLEQAGSKDPEAFLAASALAEEFLIRTGQEHEAAKYREQAMERCALLLKVEEERQHIEPDDVFSRMTCHVRGPAVSRTNSPPLRKLEKPTWCESRCESCRLFPPTYWSSSPGTAGTNGKKTRRTRR